MLTRWEIVNLQWWFWFVNQSECSISMILIRRERRMSQYSNQTKLVSIVWSKNSSVIVIIRQDFSYAVHLPSDYLRWHQSKGEKFEDKVIFRQSNSSVKPCLLSINNNRNLADIVIQANSENQCFKIDRLGWVLCPRPSPRPRHASGFLANSIKVSTAQRSPSSKRESASSGVGGQPQPVKSSKSWSQFWYYCCRVMRCKCKQT